MDLFGIGWEELLLILVIAVFVFGPGKIPDFARTLGKIVREVNKYSTALTKDFKEEFEKGLAGAEEEKRRETPVIEGTKTKDVSHITSVEPSKPEVRT